MGAEGRTAEAMDALLRALVGCDPDRVRLYQTNAWFKMAVDQLALFIPVLVDGLRRQAEERDAERADKVARLERANWPGRGFNGPGA